MKPTDRRAFLETIAETAASDQARLNALELLNRLDDREQRERSWPPDFAEELADQPEKLNRLIELADEYLFAELPAYRVRVERRAREIVEEQALERRVKVAVAQIAQDAPGDESAGEGRTRGCAS